jgi:hypothetical protein
MAIGLCGLDESRDADLATAATGILDLDRNAEIFLEARQQQPGSARACIAPADARAPAMKPRLVIPCRHQYIVGTQIYGRAWRHA